VVAATVFHGCDHLLFYQLQSWARHRHPKKNAAWVARRYWRMQPGAMWEFVVKDGGEITHRLTTHGATHIRRHVKVKGTASPFDGNLLYWARRLKDHPLTGTTLGRLLARQTGKCGHCDLTFQDGDLLEIDHVEPTSTGGTDVLSNLQVLHRHCHDQKSAADRR
jgi:RNA-directed DNA polymerase